MKDLQDRTRYYTRARVHIRDHSDFVNKIILDRDKASYPDPNLRNINDINMLKNYLSRILNAVRNYIPSNCEEENKIRDFLNKHKDRINFQIGKLKYPDPSQVDLSLDFNRIDNASFSTGYFLPDRNIDWDTFYDIFDMPISDLRYLSGYYKVNKKVKNNKHKIERIINAFRHVKGDETVDLEDIIEFKQIEDVKEDIVITKDGNELDIEEGIPFDEIKNRIKNKRSVFGNDIMYALTLANIQTITNYHHKEISNGVYYPHTTNYSENIGFDDKTSIIRRDIVAHELFHSYQDITVTRDFESSDPVDIDKNPSDWDPIIFPQPNREDIKKMQDRLKHIWFEFRQNTDNKLCDYQTKNLTDMTAVAFEAYCHEPQKLKDKQPKLYNFIEDILSI